jgi:hypothetical protein
LQAICDADESLAQRFGSFYEAQKIYLDYDEMLSDDAVVIAVSDAFHVPAAMKALSAGKHVLCEKPLGTNVYEVDELARRLPNVPSTACWARSFYILESADTNVFEAHKVWLCIRARLQSCRTGPKTVLSFTVCGKTKFFEGDGLQAVRK